MAINTELPISKVTFDDQEISLASSGGTGGGSMFKQETYFGTQIADLCTRAIELFLAGKLISMDITFTNSVSNMSLDTKYITFDLSSKSTTYTTDTYSYTSGDTMRCTPTNKQGVYNTMYFDASYGKKTRHVYLMSSQLMVLENYFTYDTSGKKIYFYDKNYVISSSHFSATLNYVE